MSEFILTMMNRFPGEAPTLQLYGLKCLKVFAATGTSLINVESLTCGFPVLYFLYCKNIESYSVSLSCKFAVNSSKH